jgi:hypothetical protein
MTAIRLAQEPDSTNHPLPNYAVSRTASTYDATRQQVSRTPSYPTVNFDIYHSLFICLFNEGININKSINLCG